MTILAARLYRDWHQPVASLPGPGGREFSHDSGPDGPRSSTAWWPLRPRSPSRQRRRGPCATVASTSMTGKSAVTFGDVGAAGGRQTSAASRRRSGTSSRRRSSPWRCASTSRPAWRCWRPSGICAPLLDIDDATARQQLAWASVMALSYVAQSARGIYQPAVRSESSMNARRSQHAS